MFNSDFAMGQAQPLSDAELSKSSSAGPRRSLRRGLARFRVAVRGLRAVLGLPVAADLDPEQRQGGAAARHEEPVQDLAALRLGVQDEEPRGGAAAGDCAEAQERHSAVASGCAGSSDPSIADSPSKLASGCSGGGRAVVVRAGKRAQK